MSLKKLMVMVYITVIAVVLLGAVSYYSLSTTGNGLEQVEEHGRLIEAVANLQYTFVEVAMPGNDYVITGSREEVANYREMDKKLLASFDQVESFNISQEERDVILEVKKDYTDQVKPVLEKIFGIGQPQGNSDAIELMKKADASVSEATANLEEFHKVISTENEELITATNSLERKALVIVIGVSIVVIALAILVAIAIKVGMIKPLAQLINATAKMAEGDLATDINVKAQGEIGQLVETFKVMLNNLRDLIQNIYHASQSVLVTSDRLVVNAERTGKSSGQLATTIEEVAKGNAQQSESISESVKIVEQLSMAINQIANGAEEQSKSVNLTSDNVNQMAASIQEVASGAQAMTKTAETTSRAAEEGGKAVERTITGMNKIKDKVFETANKIKDLGEQSQKIGEIIQVIDDIAEQTNLLALNAAIEAARAGEHGKGFAVVADEVRKLAERSGKATKEIADLITSIQKGTEGAVEAMTEGTAQVEEGSKLALAAGEALEAIMKTVDETYRQVQNISAAAEEISASSSEVVSAMDTVASITEENTASTEEMAAGSEQVSLSMNSLAAVVKQVEAAGEEASTLTNDVTSSIDDIAKSIKKLDEAAELMSNLISRFRTKQTSNRCWEIMNCPPDRQAKCPGKNDQEERCWLISGTWCGGVLQSDANAKMHRCMKCKAFTQIMEG